MKQWALSGFAVVVLFGLAMVAMKDLKISDSGDEMLTDEADPSSRPVRTRPLMELPNDVPSDLTLTPLGQDRFADCLHPDSKSQIQMKGFVYKKVFAQTIAKMVDLSAYVFYPPGYKPESGKRLPVAAFFHGGGWNMGSPVLWFPAANYFASRGIIAVSFQYRIRDFHHVLEGERTRPGYWPADTIADAKSAVRWLRKNSAFLGTDPEKIAVAGDSAGGNLAFASWYDPYHNDDKGENILISRKPNLLIGFYPSHQTRFPSARFHLDELLENADSSPKTLILHGKEDTTINPELSRHFCERVNTRFGKDTCEYHGLKGLGHAFIKQRLFDAGGKLVNASTDAMLGLSLMDLFLQKNGYLPVGSHLEKKAFQVPPHCQMMSYASPPVSQWVTKYGYQFTGPITVIPQSHHALRLAQPQQEP